MTNVEKALDYMRQLNLSDIVLENFAKGIKMQSTMNAGVLIPANEDQQNKIREIEENIPSYKVWHILSDNFVIDGEEVKIENYFVAGDDGEEDFEEMSDGFCALAYVENLTWKGMSEYGEMIIAEKNGGIIRKT